MSDMQIEAADGGSFSAYVARPKEEDTQDGKAGAVVLIQEIFGVNQAMREAADWVADLGFIAICPDLFWRLRPGVDLSDKTQAEWQEAFALMNAFDQDKGVDDIIATLAAARWISGGNGRAGTMGYCLGGRLAMMMALRSDADVNVSYYGVGLDQFAGDLDKVGRPLLLHVAEKDEFFPAEGRARLLAAAQGHDTIHAWTYPDADHAFARVGGTHWQGRAAAIANGRSAEALVQALG
jgi:carboxymethylenebutenolidase